jgi:hypothetical protein
MNQLAALSAITRKQLGRPFTTLYPRMSQNTSIGLQGSSQPKPVVIPFSSRLREGRALAQDIWSLFE